MSRTTAAGKKTTGPRKTSTASTGRRVSGATVSVAERHRAWLQLVDTDGPFLAVPPIKRAWSTGMPPVDGARLDALRSVKPAFDMAYDELTPALVGDMPPEHQAEALAAYRPARDHWVETVLRDVLGWEDMLHLDRAAADQARTPTGEVHALLDRATVTSDSGAVRRRPSGVMLHDGRPGALVWVIDPVESLRQLLDDGWAHSPIDAMVEMLRAGEVPIGLVTDGRWWALVSAPRPGTPTALKSVADDTATLPSSGIVDSLTWIEEAGVRDAFIHLLDPERLVAGRPEDWLTALFVESVAAAEEITVSLGVQVRRAVELLVQAFSESAAEARRQGLTDPLPIGADGSADEVYQGAVTVMMRVVFLLFAQERGLLPTSSVFTEAYGLVGVLDDLDRRAREEGEEALDASWLTWHRLLATSNALHRGASFEDLRLPAYGGSLFDPRRFPFLEATTEDGTLAVAVTDRVMRHVLHAVQVAVVKGEARRVSFREIDVEQIGYIYEQLLGFTARKVETVQIGLIGAEGSEAEIPVDVLDDLADEHVTDEKIAKAIATWVAEDQPSAKLPTHRALVKALGDGDGFATDRLLRAVTGDDLIRARLAPWFGIIRRGLRDRPTVFLPGGLVVEETPSRGNAGAHYTPRALAEEVVEHALAPLVYRPGPHQTGDRDAWRLRSSSEITDLRVADIACGSGAFLVAAARYLAKRLVEAWELEGITLPTGRQVEFDAIREVVAHCLYGADINPMAVEMCKLSLWIVSLDPKLPFSFVDDKLFCGNSLLGLTDLRQVEELNLYPQGRPAEYVMDLTHDNRLVARLDVAHVIRRALSLRRQLTSQVDNSEPQRSSRAKDRQLGELREVTATLRRVADGVIAAGLPLGGKPGRALEEAYENLRLAVEAAYPGEGDADPTWLDRILEIGLPPTVRTDFARWRPLHWALEVPDVLERGGFDAIVGNPPFLGGKKISGASGSNVREWYVNDVADGTKGNADLVAYFFLRAMSLLQREGNLGLIATNTVAQGDTREVGLHQMVEAGFTITRTIQSRTWPAASANLEYAAVWGTVGHVADGGPRLADNVAARHISPLLEPTGRAIGSPVRLTENLGIAYQGCNINGTGFMVSIQRAMAMIQSSRAAAQVLKPFLRGEDLNASPDFSDMLWVVDFDERSEDEAQSYLEPYAWVRSRVKGFRERQLNKPRNIRYWWRFEANAKGMRRALSHLEWYLAVTIHSSIVMPRRVAKGTLPSHGLIIFASESFSLQAVLSSSIHQSWLFKFGSTLGRALRYSRADVFETFPFPVETRRVDGKGRVLDMAREEIMLRRQIGLTQLYNLVNDPDLQGDPDVDRMRETHVEVDEAVLAAYGWEDVPLNHGFHTYRQMRRWTICPEARVEILDRLLEENHRRAALEVAAGVQPTTPAEDNADGADGEPDGAARERDEP